MATSDLPGNSHRQHSAREEKVPKTKEVPPKNVEKVVTTEAVRKKPSLGKRFTQTFIGGHAKGVWEFMLFEVIVPAGKDMLADSVSQGVERMVYGESRASGRRRGSSIQRGAGSSLIGHTSYDRISDPRLRRDEPRMTSRGRHDFDDILLATRAEADMVIERLYDLVEVYDQATVADLYELVGVTGSFTDERWGWTDMTGADSRRDRGGRYRLILPKVEPLR